MCFSRNGCVEHSPAIAVAEGEIDASVHKEVDDCRPAVSREEVEQQRPAEILLTKRQKVGGEHSVDDGWSLARRQHARHHLACHLWALFPLLYEVVAVHDDLLQVTCRLGTTRTGTSQADEHRQLAVEVLLQLELGVAGLLAVLAEELWLAGAQARRELAHVTVERLVYRELLKHHPLVALLALLRAGAAGVAVLEDLVCREADLAVVAVDQPLRAKILHVHSNHSALHLCLAEGTRDNALVPEVFFHVHLLHGLLALWTRYCTVRLLVLLQLSTLDLLLALWAVHDRVLVHHMLVELVLVHHLSTVLAASVVARTKHLVPRHVL
mmetsp:Transcript_7274/g.30935  ORF Transcript_7274/g.30935 Transcript_7274/m.30935 type:complete len:325 (+) Transcript_7274:715-1689(+)